jgi:hypothetical protein
MDGGESEIGFISAVPVLFATLEILRRCFFGLQNRNAFANSLFRSPTSKAMNASLFSEEVPAQLRRRWEIIFLIVGGFTFPATLHATLKHAQIHCVYATLRERIPPRFRRLGMENKPPLCAPLP